MATKEKWLAVVGYEGSYEVSSLGRVRSLTRQVLCGGRVTRTVFGRVLEQCPEKAYLGVALSLNGRAKSFRVHTLVARAFLGPCPAGHEACHKDGDGGNNRARNLRWGTPTSNYADKRRHGTLPVSGGLGSRINLSDATLDEIRSLKDGTLKQWAADNGVSYSHVCKIRRVGAV